MLRRDEGEGAALGHGVRGVEGEVDDDLAELDGVGVNRQLDGGQFGADFNAAREGDADGSTLSRAISFRS